MLNRFWNEKFWGVAVIVLVMCTASLSVVADDGDWIRINSAVDGSTFDFKKGTVEFVTLTDNSRAIAAVERFFYAKEKSINFHKTCVRVSDCTRGFGKLVSTHLDGTFMSQGDWVAGGGTIGSSKAEFLCAAAQNMATEQGNDSIKGIYIDKPVNAPSKK